MNPADGEAREVAWPAQNALPEPGSDLVGDPRQVAPAWRQRRLAVLAGAARHGALATRRGAQATRRGALATRRGAQATRRGVRRGSHWLTAEVLAMALRLPVRDEAALRAQFPGLSPAEVADALIDGAARASAAVGGAVGAWAVLPVVPAFPVEVASETLALVGIELKLIAELHEVYGMRVAGTGGDRMTAYVAAWAHRRGVALAPGGLILAVNSPLSRRLQRRLAARAGRSVVSLGPLLTGAAAGALINRFETRRLGAEIHRDLRQRSPQTWWPGSAPS